jgi:hypothetical protein
MKYEVIIQPLAELDLKEAFDWYNVQQPGLGNKFLDFVDRKIKLIEVNPEHYQKRFKDVRVGVLERFPYVIHFKLEGNKIIVLSFYSSKRNPKEVRKRFT